MSEKKKLWDPWNMYDVSPEEMRAIKERVKMRDALKSEWTKKYMDPYKGSIGGGYLLDPAVQRYIALKSTQADYFRGTFRSGVMATLIFFLPITIMTHFILKNKREKEKKLRNGEIMYKDREPKFLY